MNNTAVLLISSPDKKGIVATVANFIYQNNGNILHADEHIDSEYNLFFLRVEWDLEGFKLDQRQFNELFSEIAKEYQMKWKIAYGSYRPKVAIFVSKEDHCLVDLLYRHKNLELNCDISFVISNHKEASSISEFYGIPYYEISIEEGNKANAEAEALKLLKDSNIDFVVLARYMQILSADFIKEFARPIINIHHSFLPSFVGAKPYNQAFKKGVKIIGASSHYVTEDLDQGPIIEQDVLRVSHKDSVSDLAKKGRDIERTVLSRAVKWHIENKVLVYLNKTVVFD